MRREHCQATKLTPKNRTAFYSSPETQNTGRQAQATATATAKRNEQTRRESKQDCLVPKELMPKELVEWCPNAGAPMKEVIECFREDGCPIRMCCQRTLRHVMQEGKNVWTRRYVRTGSWMDVCGVSVLDGFDCYDSKT